MSVEGVRPPKVGDVIEGKYEILRRIGKGGMAVVYEARSLSLQRPVALKFLHAEMAENPSLVDRFHREARNAAAITHPCVTYVFDVGWNDDKTLPYMAMELLEGKSLAAVIRTSDALSVQRVVHIGSRVLDALEAAHRLGVVHRDLKPENIFLAQQGTQENVKVLDFGISKVLGSDSGNDSLTKTGTMLGTPAYMSPEQVKSARDVDARSDLYALGAVLYEMLVGKPAFQGESFTEVVYKILTEEPAPLLTLRPGLDASVVDLVQRAMHKDRGRRWQTAESMRAALQEVVVDTSPGEPKPTPLAWELPSPEEMSTAATVAARRAWEMQQSDAKSRAPVAAKSSASSPAVPIVTADVVAAAPVSSVRRRATPSASGARAPVPAMTVETVTTPREPGAEANPTKISGALVAMDAAGASGVSSMPLGAAPRSGPTLWVGIPLVVLVGLLAAGIALWFRTGTTPLPAPATAASPLLPPLAARPPDGLALPSTAQGCRVRLSVPTPGARILLAGESYAGTVDLPAVCGAQHTVRIEAPGHVPQTLDVMASAGPPRLVELAPLVTTAPTPPASARREPPRSAPRHAASRPQGDGDRGDADPAPDAPEVHLESNPF